MWVEAFYGRASGFDFAAQHLQGCDTIHAFKLLYWLLFLKKNTQLMCRKPFGPLNLEKNRLRYCIVQLGHLYVTPHPHVSSSGLGMDERGWFSSSSLFLSSSSSVLLKMDGAPLFVRVYEGGGWSPLARPTIGSVRAHKWPRTAANELNSYIRHRWWGGSGPSNFSLILLKYLNCK